MSWVRLDDQMPDHPKLCGLGDFAPLAFCLQLRAMCYASRHLTDGHIPAGAVPGLLTGFAAWGIEMGGVKGEFAVGQNGDDFDWPDMMVKAGLWTRRANGFQIHDYLAYNPSREIVLKRREDNARWQKGFRERKGLTKDTSKGGSKGDVSNAPAPTPMPEAKKKKPSARPAQTWLTPFLDCWVSECGGVSPAPGRMGKALSPLWKAHGTETVVSRLRFYLQQSNGKSSPEHFAQTFGKWEPKDDPLNQRSAYASDFDA